MQKLSDRISLTTLPVLVPKPDLGPERGAFAVGPVRGALAVGPPATAVGPPDVAVRAALALLDESAGRVVRFAVSRGRGRGLGSQPGRGGRPSLRGGPVQGSAHVLGCGLALPTDRDQLRSFVAVPLKMTTSLKLSSLRVWGPVQLQVHQVVW